MERVSRPRPPTGLRRWFVRTPVPLYRCGLGWLFGDRFVLLEHVGRRTGRLRRAVLEVVTFDRAAGTVTVAACYGLASDWYRNLLAHPEVTIVLGRHRRAVRAVQLSADDAGEAMVDYARRNPRAARVLARYMGFRVDGRLEEYREMAREFPFIRFHPRS